ncbi:carbon storage regulator [Thalassoroseus pseudoceratinae]|uniref:carbon storage regulator n=1 Tax=Thalassoroseus pseudoceratinae TaxID=2713176 RepID=UPI00141F058D|nr:carbon storage regulator [Thalassoroseus pseudoceratinae]
MLVLTRKVGEQIQIGEEIQLTITQIKGDRIRLGIAAPREVSVVRRELHSPDEATDFATVGPE